MNLLEKNSPLAEQICLCFWAEERKVQLWWEAIHEVLGSGDPRQLVPIEDNILNIIWRSGPGKEQPFRFAFIWHWISTELHGVTDSKFLTLTGELVLMELKGSHHQHIHMHQEILPQDGNQHLHPWVGILVCLGRHKREREKGLHPAWLHSWLGSCYFQHYSIWWSMIGSDKFPKSIEEL